MPKMVRTAILEVLYLVCFHSSETVEMKTLPALANKTEKLLSQLSSWYLKGSMGWGSLAIDLPRHGEVHKTGIIKAGWSVLASRRERPLLFQLFHVINL